MTTPLDWEVDQGATFRVQVTYTDGDGQPVDLTGYSAKLQIRRDAHDPDPALVTLTDSDGLTLGDDGTIGVVFTDEQTAGWTFAEGVFDLLITTPGGEKYRILRGVVHVSAAVTR